MSTKPRKPGKVFLIGAGPGDPGMLTLRACECLGRADVVLYDYLVNPLVLTHARQNADLVCLGRHGGDRRDRIMPQEEINRRLVALAREGRVVARLKGGDPTIFGHAIEEIESLATAGIEFEIVPGVTAALAAGAFATIPLTHGQLASAVAFVTGQERDDKDSSSLDFGSLAAFPGTLVFYMGITTAHRWTTALIDAGKSPDTPAAIIHRCSWPDQTTTVCKLGEVAAVVEEQKLRPPALVIVGDVVPYAPALDWFTRRPLFGKKILVTRPRDRFLAIPHSLREGLGEGKGQNFQTDRLATGLSELGAQVLHYPAIEIHPPDDWTAADAALDRLAEYDWLVFSSANGVRAVIDRLLSQGRDLRALGGVRLAAIGPGTADELSRCLLRADRTPDEYRAESLVEALESEAKAGQRFLLARASRGRETLAEGLRAAGGQVDQMVVYSSIDVDLADPDIASALKADAIDWITVTSSAIARSLFALFGEDLRRARLASISPATSETLRALGLAPAAEAKEYTLAGLVEAIHKATP